MSQWLTRDESLPEGDNRAARVLCNIYRPGTVTPTWSVGGLAEVPIRAELGLSLARGPGNRGWLPGCPRGTERRCRSAACQGVAW